MFLLKVIRFIDMLDREQLFAFADIFSELCNMFDIDIDELLKEK